MSWDSRALLNICSFKQSLCFKCLYPQVLFKMSQFREPSMTSSFSFPQNNTNGTAKLPFLRYVHFLHKALPSWKLPSCLWVVCSIPQKVLSWCTAQDTQSWERPQACGVRRRPPPGASQSREAPARSRGPEGGLLVTHCMWQLTNPDSGLHGSPTWPPPLEDQRAGLSCVHNV